MKACRGLIINHGLTPGFTLPRWGQVWCNLKWVGSRVLGVGFSSKTEFKVKDRNNLVCFTADHTVCQSVLFLSFCLSFFLSSLLACLLLFLPSFFLSFLFPTCFIFSFFHSVLYTVFRCFFKYYFQHPLVIPSFLSVSISILIFFSFIPSFCSFSSITFSFFTFFLFSGQMIWMKGKTACPPSLYRPLPRRGQTVGCACSRHVLLHPRLLSVWG